jgi:hypothetical protein
MQVLAVAILAYITSACIFIVDNSLNAAAVNITEF